MPLFGRLSKKQPSCVSGKIGYATEENDTQNGSIASMTKECINSPSNNKECTMSTAVTNNDDQTTKFSSQRLKTISNGRGARSNRSNESSPRTSFRSPTPPPPPDSVKTIKGGNPMSCHLPPPQDTKLVFHCQLAHGSPTGLLYGFANIRELYERAAECYEIPFDDILFCTLNTHKVEMDRLLGGQVGLNDFIFIHVHGQKKEVEVVKDEPSLGVTITDNGAGKAFIKRIKPNSVMGRLVDIIRPGDHIERINNESMVGKKHFDVAKSLRELPLNATFTLRLIEPLKATVANSSPRSSIMSSSFIALCHANANGTKTLRFKAKGAKAPTVTDSPPSAVVLDRINAVLESYLGIHDSDLALTIWDLAKEPANASNPVSFLSAFRRSELSEFQLPDETVFDLWAATKEGLFQSVTSRTAGNEGDSEKTLTPSRPGTSVIK